MSKRPPPWWKAPLAWWCTELYLALIECSSLEGVDARQVAMTITTLNDLLKHEDVERMLRQHLGAAGPKVVAWWRQVAAYHRRKAMQPALAFLVLDAELHPRRIAKRSKARTHTVRIAEPLPIFLRSAEEQHAAFRALSLTERRCVCAAGYLLLAAALMPWSAMGVSESRYAETAAMKLMRTTAWLYGKPCYRPVSTLVQAITGRRFFPSSMRWRIARP
jgi:hypothetical protein